MRNLFSRMMLVVLVAFMFAACATRYDARGMYHKARKGETLQSIAEYYKVKPEDIARLNYIDTDTSLTKGQKIYLGGAKHGPVKIAKARKGKRFGYKGMKGQFDKPLALEDVKFSWPVNGTVYSSYGIRHGRRHDGLDISAKSGTPILAAADGVVVFNGYMRGYGNILILQHGKRVFSTYAHNQENLVNEGDVARKGDLIANVGSTGRSTGPHVHFEVRYGADAKNPIFYLPLETDEHRALYAAASASESSGRAVASRTLGVSHAGKKMYSNRLRDKERKLKAKDKAKDNDSKQLAKKDDKKNRNKKDNKKQTIASKNKAEKQTVSTASKTQTTNTSKPQPTDITAKAATPVQSPMQQTKNALAKKAADKQVADKKAAAQTAQSTDKPAVQQQKLPIVDKATQQKQTAKKAADKQVADKKAAAQTAQSTDKPAVQQQKLPVVDKATQQKQTAKKAADKKVVKKAVKKGDVVKKTVVSKKAISPAAAKVAVKKSTATVKPPVLVKKPGDLTTRKQPEVKKN